MNKQLTGRKVTFNSDIENFKVKGSLVTINLTADAQQIDLNQLSKIAENDLVVDLTSVQTELLDEPEKEK
ncbi:hypothetical protein [Lactobacillus sp. PV034]|uniref:hypothetical protein n=1 Tax=Lactobacillus sp. PV034 TaxID=2594495 RepID=UPI00223ED4EF|nr:hypothetical protein [Lactobacillus sp. PV034]QNQ80800.1 hypothetical protein FP432_04145 [Lactobacillus sp. PV034]